MNLAYKSLTANNLSPYQGFAWPMPKGKRPGRWVKAEGELDVCGNGIHVCDTVPDLLRWLDSRIVVIEWRGESIRADKESKRVVGEARVLRVIDAWNEKSARLFAADCAERVLPIFEDKFPDDNRQRKAIEAARAFAFGEIGGAELQFARDAAGDAALAARAAALAAGDAAGDAAWYAAYAARNAAGDAAYAAWYAAYAARNAAYAAWAAAETAAETAARAAAYTTRAAGDAALAARAAALAAGDAAGAAWAAAWDAECEWQAARLAEVIGGLE